ncbi:MAG: DUF2282 domain-containing protein [Xanthomonadaceae bacterium]|nr:DUF2282 domain-containing protein [Xanthomonadaceae bacterium]MDE2496563.1 DUF2282 domain-containing protein [Xanthomonadaceae bacterium]
MNSTTLLKTSLACVVTLGMASLASTAFAGQHDAMTKMSPPQKTDAMMAKLHYAPCYGINAAYKNDCVSPGHSCAGQDPKAHDAQAFVAMPAGLCTKIDGGSLKAG